MLSNYLKASLFSLILTTTSFEVIAQSTYKDDLQVFYDAIKKTPSYKDQITGQRKSGYDLQFERLKIESPQSNAFDSLYKLSSLLWPIKDNHLGLYQVSNKEISSHKRYPISAMNLDSLEEQLLSKPLKSPEGIYYQGDRFKIGVYSTSNKDSLIGVILSSSLPIWSIGEMAVLLVKHTQDGYRGVYANLYNKDLFFVRNEKLINGKLLFGTKKGSPVNYASLLDKPEFGLKTLGPDIQYLRLSSFRTSNNDIKKAEVFYDRIKDSITSKSLIVDLRNNPGGGFKSSGMFLSLLKKYAEDCKLFIIVNRQTVSNAEQFVLKLKGYKNVVVLGETTNGTLTYGNNFGNSVKLPSGKYTFYITDMKDSGNYLPYEEIGVEPDLKLSPGSDWIEQVTAIIRNK
ncbi:S41 family peptidase [Pedobacter immunditicola]|uniref:S41 family peptidase n=1 Tax=Pedobacter immunditicola TaxID=3133440 RepID=UPI00309FF679